MKQKIAFTLFILTLTFQFGFAQELAHIKLDSLNSNYDEHSPILSPDGQTLYFTVAGHPVNVGGVIDQGDIWFATKTSAGWTSAQHAGEVLNHPGLNGVVGFSQDGNRMYTLNYFDKDSRGGGNLKNGISVSEKINGEWQQPEQLPIQYFLNSSGHLSATISKNESILVMSIESYQTEGNEDLYVSFKQADGQWSQPKTLGGTLNTGSEEWTPYLSEDTNTLYFASNGHGGEGSRDIFKSERLDGSWSNWSVPENLGASINTKGVERGFSIPFGSELAYFSSTQNSEGFGDIAAWEVPQEVTDEIIAEIEDAPSEVPEDTADSTTAEAEVISPIANPDAQLKPVVSKIAITFQVLDKRTEAPVEAQVTFRWANKEVGVNTATLGTENNKFVLNFDEGAEVTASINAPGFLNYEEVFVAAAGSEASVKDDTKYTAETFLLTPEDVGTVEQIENVLFNRASASFSEPRVAQREVDKLIRLMKSNPGMAIRLEGHTDNRGNAKLLKELSEERVKTVRRYMITRGISGSRIEFVGYGGEKPLMNDDSAEAREKNRRVEFVIIR